ncbi:PREDICTED: S-acyl fatty acid synthase thioesterase, medium chain [Cyprinodon variegatus]|uniref:S-acyl fatty acid synthase thioesterase, medium chain n=1 Tax=Cyprinodon variegatus TaxID=28743 RepID=UPI0007426A94|nr:PREDICTED: S-acyl fatty acid synthase thioesterase, medium chain [Cyprinodon variegatus]
MEKVISCFRRRPEAVTRLICFPWAGGGSIHYARWGNVLNSSVEASFLSWRQINTDAVFIFQSEIRAKAPKRSELSDEQFLRWLTSIGGTPPELLANPEVLKLFLPALKADLHVVENYRWTKPDAPFLACPVTCFDGKEDVPHDLQAWRSITSGDFTIRMFDGSHFYLKDAGNEKILLDHITKALETAEMDYL